MRWKGGKSIIFPSLNILIISKHIIFMVWVEISGCAVSKWLRNSKDGQVYLTNDYASTHSLQLHFSLLPWANLKISSLFTHAHAHTHLFQWKVFNFLPAHIFFFFFSREIISLLRFQFLFKTEWAITWSCHKRPKTKIDIRKIHESLYSV